MRPPTTSQNLASHLLQSTAKAVSTPLTEFEKWLVGGLGAGIGLLLPRLGELAATIGHTRTVWVLLLLGLAFLFALAILVLGVQVQSVSNVHETRAQTKAIIEEDPTTVDLDDVMDEAARGMWWPASLGFNHGRRSVMRGDYVASARLVARLSQIQVWFVMAQLVVIIAAVSIAAAGAL